MENNGREVEELQKNLEKKIEVIQQMVVSRRGREDFDACLLDGLAVAGEIVRDNVSQLVFINARLTQLIQIMKDGREMQKYPKDRPAGTRPTK